MVHSRSASDACKWVRNVGSAVDTTTMSSAVRKVPKAASTSVHPQFVARVGPAVSGVEGALPRALVADADAPIVVDMSNIRFVIAGAAIRSTRTTADARVRYVAGRGCRLRLSRELTGDGPNCGRGHKGRIEAVSSDDFWRSTRSTFAEGDWIVWVDVLA